MSRLRVSEEQARLLFGGKPAAATKRAPRQQKRAEELPENIAESRILGFLRARGWVVTRQQVGLYVPYRVLAEMREGKSPKVIPIRIGETGQCDWLAQRPHPNTPFCAIESFEFEAKAAGRKPKPDQVEYIRKRVALGFHAEWFDGVEPDECLKPLAPWYAEHAFDGGKR